MREKTKTQNRERKLKLQESPYPQRNTQKENRISEKDSKSDSSTLITIFSHVFLCLFVLGFHPSSKPHLLL